MSTYYKLEYKDRVLATFIHVINLQNLNYMRDNDLNPSDTERNSASINTIMLIDEDAIELQRIINLRNLATGVMRSHLTYAMEDRITALVREYVPGVADRDRSLDASLIVVDEDF